MFTLDRNTIKMIKETFPKGTRIEVISMQDPYTKLNTGEQGTVIDVDDIGTIHVLWDRGIRLGLIYNEDEFKKV